MTKERGTLGDNLPPLMRHQDAMECLYAEAKNWLDGAKVEDQATADAIAKLLAMIRKASSAAEAARKADKEPHLAAGKAVDAAYKPILDMAERASAACKKALQPFLLAQEAEKQRQAAEARRVAEEAAKAAKEAFAQADLSNLAEAEKAEQAYQAAKDAHLDAKAAGKDHAKAKVDGGRAVALRSTFEARIVNATDAARHIWMTYPDDMAAFIQTIAERAVRQGIRQFPGVEIIETKEVV